MLQKISLILLCGLVVVPTQFVHADKMCLLLFAGGNEAGSLVQSTPGNLTTHNIKHAETGITFKITRNSSELVELNRDAQATFSLLTNNVPVLISKSKAVFQSYSPNLPFQSIAKGISEIQLAFLDARGRSESQLSFAKDGARGLRNKINDEIIEIRRKIKETENLAYELDMITDLVAQLPGRSFRNHISIHNNLLKTSLSKILILKSELSIAEALKQDLIKVVETQTLKPSELSKRFYTAAEAAEQAQNLAQDHTPVSKINIPFPAQKPVREFIPQEDHSMGRTAALPAQAERNSRVKQGERIIIENIPPQPLKSNHGTSTTDAERRRSRVTTEAPTYTEMTGSTAGSSTLRAVYTSNPVNTGRGTISGSYSVPAGTTAKVDLNTQSRNMILNLKYEATSKSFPAKEVLEQLRAWAQKFSIANQITFSHSGRVEDPITVTVKIKDEAMEQFYLNKLKTDFASRNAILLENPNAPTRIQPALPKAPEAEKPPTVLQKVKGAISDVIYYTPALRSKIND